MGLTLCNTARRISRSKGVCVFIPPAYELMVHQSQTPGFLLLSRMSSATRSRPVAFLLDMPRHAIQGAYGNFIGDCLDSVETIARVSVSSFATEDLSAPGRQCANGGAPTRSALPGLPNLTTNMGLGKKARRGSTTQRHRPAIRRPRSPIYRSPPPPD